MRDLVRWERNLELGTVGGEAVLARLATRGRLNDGTLLDYALGQVHGDHRGLTTVSHGGALGGYRTVHLRFPAQRLAVFILANRSDARTGDLARSIADIYLEGAFPDPEPGEPPGPQDQPAPSPARWTTSPLRPAWPRPWPATTTAPSSA